MEDQICTSVIVAHNLLMDLIRKEEPSIEPNLADTLREEDFQDRGKCHDWRNAESTVNSQLPLYRLPALLCQRIDCF